MESMKNIIAEFKGSFPDLQLCPETNQPEFAFIGRSNVGKSSLINMICGKVELALTSGKPGKTRMLNYFHINSKWFLVDLPGYGYAITSKAMRKEWEKMIRTYLSKRDNLYCTFVLIDSRIPPQQLDIDLLNWLGEARIPFVIVYTKTDKLSTEEYEKNTQAFKDALSETWNDLPMQFPSSAKTSSGRDNIIKYIEQLVKQYEQAY
jgi:GTP-binding protein